MPDQVRFLRRRAASRASGLVAGYALDRVFGDPRRCHPVAGFGTLATGAERIVYRDNRSSGVVHVVLLVGGTVALGAAASSLGRRVADGVGVPAGVCAEVALTAVSAWAALGGTSLATTGTTMASHLSGPDLTDARALLPSLCGRDPSVLDRDGLARAALESVAENTSDATVGVLVWGALAGVPGILGYRAINTLDAMIGYRSPKYRNFGWCAARLDDVVNLVPARLTGLLTVAVAPLIGGSRRDALEAWRYDASRHPSPNAGVAEATAAGALGVQLGGRTEYAHGVEIRPTLGSGRTPTPRDLERAARLSTLVQVSATIVSAVLAVAIGQARIVSRLRR